MGYPLVSSKKAGFPRTNKPPSPSGGAGAAAHAGVEAEQLTG